MDGALRIRTGKSGKKNYSKLSSDSVIFLLYIGHINLENDK